MRDYVTFAVAVTALVKAATALCVALSNRRKLRDRE